MEEYRNKVSRRITQPKIQGASQAMLYATGMTEADMSKPQVGISSVWYDGNSCNMHLNALATVVKEGVVEAGLVGMRFNTIGVSDGISMGTEGMSYSLQSRDLIADSIETVMCAQWYDANISLPGCDKNMPGTLIAMARVNRPSLMVYGGTIKAGKSSSGETLDIVSAFESYGQYIAGSIDEPKRKDIVRNACPGAGACGGMYTANTMSCAIEALGMSLPYSSSSPAEDPAKLQECRRAGAAIALLLEKDIKPSDIMTPDSFRNAMAIVMVLGGSTNAVLHLLAIAHAIGVPLTIDDFQQVSDRLPYLADLKPSGRYVMEDLHKVGGTPAVMKRMLENGALNGDCLTVTGKTLAENLAGLPPLADGQQVIRPFGDPIQPHGHIQILRGRLAPEGSVGKITGKQGYLFSGRRAASVNYAAVALPLASLVVAYSARSAPTGSIRVTRRAGIQEAANATTAKTAGTTENVNGSSVGTPYRRRDSSWERAAATTSPKTPPTATSLSPPVVNIHTTELGSAPREIRIPTSFARRETA